MPKATTVNEFDSLMAEITGVPTVDRAVAVETSPSEAPGVDATPDAVHSVVADKPVSKSYREPVTKTVIEFPGCPFESSVADGRGYVNLQFSRFSKAFLHDDKAEAVVEFFEKHGRAWLAKCRAAGLR